MVKDFVHLHVHSDYSFLDGAASITKLVKKASFLGMKALALTDHGNMSGAVEFYKKCKKASVKPIIGMEAYIDPAGIRAKSKVSDFRHLTLLCKNEAGYKNLVKLSSLGFIEGYFWGRARQDIDILGSYSEGLIALGGCMSGEIPRRLLAGDEKGAEKFAGILSEIFHGDFYLELMDIGLPQNDSLNRAQIELAKKAGIGVVATNDVHFIDKQDHLAHEALLCINTKKTFTDEDRMTSPKGIYFKSQAEMYESFREVPEALENTVKIAEKCVFEMTLDPNSPRLPDFDIPPGFKRPEEYLKHLTWEGAKQKFKGGMTEKIVSRIEEELSVIEQTGYAGYFLIIADIVREAKKNKIRVGPGRGSAVGSMVLYCLDIVTINPMEYSLLFERFLNPERVTAPDIDLDFADDRRNEVIEYMVRRFGRDAVCYIGTAASLGARQVVRDVAKVLGLTPKEIDELSSNMPETYFIDKPSEDSRSDVEWVYENNLNGFREKVDSDARLVKLVQIASKLEGLKRQPGIHAAGFIIAPGNLTDFVPLRKDKFGQIVCQYDMDSITDVGLIKVDILGLTALTTIDKTVDLIEKSRNNPVDMEKISLEDKKTFKLLSSGQTKGIFQLESKGMKNLCVQLKPESIQEVIAIISLYRPGPMDHIDKFIARKNRKEKTDFLHECLKPILEETYGIPIYQEQVMQITSAVAGYNLGKADILRRAMGKKKKEVMESEKENFFNGARERGIDKKTAQKIWEMIEPFAGYGFNKSHGAGYAFLAYYTAYLKTHYPVEFITATLTTEISNTDKIAEFVEEARRLKINILPPQVNYSEVAFSVENKYIRYALGAIKNVGEKAANEIVHEREERGLFKDFDDFLNRINFDSATKRTVEYLVKAGAFDDLDPDRKKLLDYFDKGIEKAASKKKHKLMGQIELFGNGELDRHEIDSISVDPWSYREKVDAEQEAFGFKIDAYPLEEYKKFINFKGLCEICELPNVKDENCYAAGMLIKVENGKESLNLTLEDKNTVMEVVLVNPDSKIHSGFLSRKYIGKIIAVRGVTKKVDGKKILYADEAKPIDDAISQSKKFLQIEIKEEDMKDSVLNNIKEAIDLHNGECEVFFLLRERNRKIKIKSGLSVCFDRSLVNELENIVDYRGKVKYVAEISC
ncbi:DNA polymerase III subunit alpha [candidate division WOR-3 bacterium]|nr:DNA polymerase III subunit alpha [candidate division WOR-3 bacterium]